jgi:hypothetical protein
MVPGTKTVPTMPPLALRQPLSRSWPATSAGNVTRHSALVSRTPGC